MTSKKVLNRGNKGFWDLKWEIGYNLSFKMSQFKDTRPKWASGIV